MHALIIVLMGLILFSSVQAGGSHRSASAVKTVAIEKAIFFPGYQFSATVVASEQSVINAEISAKLLKLIPKLDAVVNKGDKIAEFDCRDLKDDFSILTNTQRELEANLKLNKLQLNRVSNLKAKQLTSEFAVDELVAQQSVLSAQQASLKSQKASLNR